IQFQVTCRTGVHLHSEETKAGVCYRSFRIVTGNRWRLLPGQLGAEIAFMMPSKSRIGIRQCPEHRAKQRVYFALSLGAKLSGLYSVLVANRHRVGRKTHRAANVQMLPRKKFPEQKQGLKSSRPSPSGPIAGFRAPPRTARVVQSEPEAPRSGFTAASDCSPDDLDIDGHQLLREAPVGR